MKETRGKEREDNIREIEEELNKEKNKGNEDDEKNKEIILSENKNLWFKMFIECK